MPQTCIPPLIAYEAALAFSTSPKYTKKREFIKDKPLSSCINKLVADDVGVDRIGGNKDDAANEFDQGFNEFDEACKDIDQEFNEFHEAGNHYEVHEGGDNAVNKEVTKEENHDRNEVNDENVEMRYFSVDDGNEDNIEIDEENHEKSDECEDNDDSYLWVDEDNIIPDVEVDMRDFYMSIDLEAKFLEKGLSKHRDNETDEVNEELDVIDNDQWDSLDDGSDIDRKRRVALKVRYKRNIFVVKNDKMRLRETCKGTVAFNDGHVGEPTPCPWVIQGRAVSNMLLNNLCEVFNSKLIEGRDKPLITCLEYIREYMMNRICNVIKGALLINKFVGLLTPSATNIMEKNVNWASQYTARWNGSDKYQVQGLWQDQHVVDMIERVCSCRKWELIGLPCKHVIAVLNDKVDNGEELGELHTYAHRVH
ncbi:unnamed protein product [Lactuca saligna]|uniref:SWIM-type domain-containing protein n=1 Tax=Lactuca saligna TaxID=75948 RepID=A0AA36EJS1_LACSI|nr:unnamed protein product [Lactuca saligna]